MSVDLDQKKLYQKELEVNSLLEITQAINNNLAEKDLYKIYEFTLRANLQIGKMALYVMEEEWECKAQFGNKLDFSTHPLDSDYFEYYSKFSKGGKI